MTNRLIDYIDEPSYSCVMFRMRNGPYFIGKRRYDVIWDNLPEDPKNSMKSRMVAECIITGEEAIRRFNKEPKKVVARTAGRNYFPELSSKPPRTRIWSGAFI